MICCTVKEANSAAKSLNPKMDPHLPNPTVTEDQVSAVHQITLADLQFNLDKKSTSRSKRLVGVQELQRAIGELREVRVWGLDDRNPALEDLNLRFAGPLRPVREAEGAEEEPKLPVERPKSELKQGKEERKPAQTPSPLQATGKEKLESSQQPTSHRDTQLEARPIQPPVPSKAATSSPSPIPLFPIRLSEAGPVPYPSPTVPLADSDSESEELDPAKLSIERQTNVEVRGVAEVAHTPPANEQKELEVLTKNELVQVEIRAIQALEAEKAAIAAKEATALEALRLSKAREEALALEHAKALEAAQLLETAKSQDRLANPENPKPAVIQTLDQALVANAQAEGNGLLEETAKFPSQSPDFTLVGSEGYEGESLLQDTASEAMTRHQLPHKQDLPREKTTSDTQLEASNLHLYGEQESSPVPDITQLTDTWLGTQSGALRPIASLSPVRKRHRPNRLLVNPILRHMSGRNSALASFQSSIQRTPKVISPTEGRKPTTHLSLPPIVTTEVSRAFSQASYLPRSQKAGALYPTKYAAAHINYELDLLVKPFSPFKCTKLVVEGSHRTVRRSLESRGTGRNSSRPSEIDTLRSESQSPDPKTTRRHS